LVAQFGSMFGEGSDGAPEGHIRTKRFPFIKHRV